MRQAAEHTSKPLSFGRLLRELRLGAGLSQEALAERAQMSVGGVGVLERGIRRAPQRQTLELLADALDLGPTERENFEAVAKRAGSGRRPRGQEPEGTARHNLPYALTSFVGREQAMTTLRSDIQEHRLVTVTGAGGVGKTRLSLETAHALLDTLRDGVWFVELAQLADAGVVAQRVAETLGVNASEAAVSDEWMDALAERAQLLILDNCEHLLAACAELAGRLLARCPHLHILATSRERLHVIGERVVRVASLHESAALELFLDRAASASSGFAIAETDEQSWHAVQTICAHLDGIPFAIELAAARVSALPLTTIAANIGQRLSILRHGSASVPRYKTMRELIDWSYDLLPESQRCVLEDLSVFGNGCTLESAYAVGVGDVDGETQLLEILASLVDKSLVVVDVDFNDARYTVLQTTREYAHEKLAAHGRLEDVARRHASAYLQLAESFDERWSRSPNRAWNAQARSELENWRIAINWTIGEARDVLLGQRLIGALAPVWSIFALAEGRKWCRHALELVDDSTPSSVVAGLEYTEGLLGFLAGDFNRGLPAAQRALDSYRSLDDRGGAAKAETIVGRMLLESGYSAEGESALSNALDTASSIDNPILAAAAHQGLGLSRASAGDIHGARDHVAKALAIAKEAAAERIAVVAGMVAAEAHFLAGDRNAAIDLARDALAVARELGDEFAIMRALSNLATYLIACDRYDEARDEARRALEFSHVAQGAAAVSWPVHHLAMVAAARGDHATAARLFGFAESRMAKIRSYGDASEQQEQERLRSILESVLSASELEILMSSGAVINEPEAIREALSI
jgi:predicted ATPase